MERLRLTNVLLTLALAATGIIVAVLLYGLGTRTLTPRTVPTRAVVADSAAQAAEAARRSRVTVEVRNGSGTNGLAATATALLKRRGFDAMNGGNAADTDSTRVVVLNGRADDARHVAAALGVAASRVSTDRTPDENALDVAVTLGRDHASLAPLNAP